MTAVAASGYAVTLLTHLDATNLRDLGAVLTARAAVLEAQDPGRRVVARLSPEAVEELADMLIAGRTPALGAWRRWLRESR